MSDVAPVSGTVGDNPLSERAQRHLWMHFTRLGTYGAHHEVPVMVRGEGPYVWDQGGSATSTACRGSSPARSATVAPNWPRPPPNRPVARLLPAMTYAHPGPSSWPSGSPR